MTPTRAEFHVLLALMRSPRHGYGLMQDVEELSGHLNGNGYGRQLISSSEAARLLGVSQQTLNRAVRDGRVRPAVVTPGGHRRFDTSEIIAGREQGGGQNA